MYISKINYHFLPFLGCQLCSISHPSFLRPHHFSHLGYFCVDDITVQCTRDPEPRQRPLSDTISRTLQKSDRALLSSSAAVTTSDDDTFDQQSMMLGAHCW